MLPNEIWTPRDALPWALRALVVAVTVAVMLSYYFACSLLNAAVVVDLWAWFLSPLGAPAITVAHAFGLSILVGATKHTRPCAKKEDQSTWEKVLEIFTPAIRPVLAWLFGYAAHYLMESP